MKLVNKNAISSDDFRLFMISSGKITFGTNKQKKIV